MWRSSLALLMFTFALLSIVSLLVGCGGNASSVPATPAATPTPPSSTPPSSGGGTGSSGSGSGGTGSSAPLQYSAAINADAPRSTGQITVDTAGKGVLAMQTAASSTVQVDWCNYPDGNGCGSVGRFTSDTTGNVNGTFTFPGHGDFAGVFNLTVGTARFSAGWSIPNGGSGFQALLLPVGSISAGLGQDGAQIGIGNDPISSGSVTVAANSSMAHFAVQGALPSSNYPVTFCFNSGSSSCFALGVLITDSSGNGSFDTDLSKDAITPSTGLSGVFFLHRQTDPQHAPYEYVSGLKVP